MTKYAPGGFPPPEDSVKVGDVFDDGRSPVRVMAIVEGYAMARRKGCMPYVVYAKDLLRAGWERVTDKSTGDECSK